MTFTLFFLTPELAFLGLVDMQSPAGRKICEEETKPYHHLTNSMDWITSSMESSRNI